MNPENIRAEWLKEGIAYVDTFIGEDDVEGRIADWWLAKIDSLLSLHNAEITANIEKIKQRFNCGACDSNVSSLSHTQCCIALTLAIDLLGKLVKK